MADTLRPDIRQIAREAAEKASATDAGVLEDHHDALAFAVAGAVLRAVEMEITRRLTPALNTGTAMDALVLVGEALRELGGVPRG